MTTLKDLEVQVAATFSAQWKKREGRLVPSTEDLTLGNDAVEFDRATVLYADLQASTDMVDNEPWTRSAEIYKNFLHCAASIIRDEGGAITAYDGDRVMGIWVGNRQTTPAAIAGLKINYVVQNVINPALQRQYPDNTRAVKQVVGIDTSSLRATRTGVRGDNDLVWVGRAANYAAKLTTLNLAERTWLTADAFDRLRDEAKYGGTPPQLMWKNYTWTAQNNAPIYGSTWTWRPN